MWLGCGLMSVYMYMYNAHSAAYDARTTRIYMYTQQTHHTHTHTHTSYALYALQVAVLPAMVT